MTHIDAEDVDAASHKQRIRCGAREAGPRVATIFTRRRRRMLSPSRSWPSQRDALCVQQTWDPLGVSVGVDVYIRRVCHHARVCTDGSRKLAETLADQGVHSRFGAHYPKIVRQNCRPSIVRDVRLCCNSLLNLLKQIR